MLSTTTTPDSVLLHTFPSFSSVLGLAEVEPNNIYAAVSNFSLAIPSFGLGTSTIQSLDLSNYVPGDSDPLSANKANCLTS